MHLHNEPGFDRSAWIAKSRAQAIEAVPKWLEAVRLKYGQLLGLDNFHLSLILRCLPPGTDARYCAVGQELSLFPQPPP